MNGIFGFTQLLEVQAANYSPAQIKDISKQITNSAQRLHQLIRNFLLYSELELASLDRNKLEKLLAGSTFSANKNLTTVATNKAKTYDRVADLQLQLEEATVPVGKNWFWKITEELIDNAFKFSEPDSLVTVASLSHSNTWILSVRDEGRGMSQEQITQVGAYMQFASKLHEQEGSGLGLALAKCLAELYGGNLTINSVLGEGTTVEVILPLSS